MKENFGVSMTRYVKDHEKAIKSKNVSYEQHLQKLKWMQHERLVHLIVMSLTVVSMFFCLTITTLVDNCLKISFGLLTMILLVLSMFYIKHYFFLENHIQHWYVVAEELNPHSEKANCEVLANEK